MILERRRILELFDSQKDYVEDKVNSGIELYRKGYANITVKDENDESIVVIKKMDLDNTTDSHIDEYVKKLLEQTHKKYDDILTALAEL